jgi:hypothetical protein
MSKPKNKKNSRYLPRSPAAKPAKTTETVNPDDDLTPRSLGDYATVITMLLFTSGLFLLLLDSLVVAFRTGETCGRHTCLHWSSSPITVTFSVLIKLFFLLAMGCGVFVCLKSLFTRRQR